MFSLTSKIKIAERSSVNTHQNCRLDLWKNTFMREKPIQLDCVYDHTWPRSIAATAAAAKDQRRRPEWLLLPLRGGQENSHHLRDHTTKVETQEAERGSATCAGTEFRCFQVRSRNIDFRKITILINFKQYVIISIYFLLQWWASLCWLPVRLYNIFPPWRHSPSITSSSRQSGELFHYVIPYGLCSVFFSILNT